MRISETEPQRNDAKLLQVLDFRGQIRKWDVRHRFVQIYDGIVKEVDFCGIDSVVFLLTAFKCVVLTVRDDDSALRSRRGRRRGSRSRRRRRRRGRCGRRRWFVILDHLAGNLGGFVRREIVDNHGSLGIEVTTSGRCERLTTCLRFAVITAARIWAATWITTSVVATATRVAVSVVVARVVVICGRFVESWTDGGPGAFVGSFRVVTLIGRRLAETDGRSRIRIVELSLPFAQNEALSGLKAAGKCAFLILRENGGGFFIVITSSFAKKNPVDFDDELKIGDVWYDNMTKITIKVQLFWRLPYEM